MYATVRTKFFLTLGFATAWLLFSVYLSVPWFHDLSEVVGEPLSAYLITFIAIVPGFMNAFVLAALALDQRPTHHGSFTYPPVTILIAVYNEENCIQDTLLSLQRQNYPGAMEILVLNDGSNDGTAAILADLEHQLDRLKILNFETNHGKSYALNVGIKHASHDLLITVDGDSFVKSNGITNLVERYLSDPPNTAAVAGEVLIRNSRQNWITKAQEWDYFLGIAAVKRIQSLFQGTLVAQGAFSLYQRQIIERIGGWPMTIGEDIVLTWRLLDAGYRIGHAEDACVFTQCPDTLSRFIRQRQRWSRGLIEAFKENPRILFRQRLSTIYIWWNLIFPLMDLAYTIGFIPGILLACFGYFWIVGPMTLALLPATVLLNRVMLRAGEKMFAQEGLKIRANLSGFIFYILAYGIILQPACVYGYLSEIFRLRKNWGTK